MEKQQSAESRVTDLVEEIISLDTLETSFNLFLVHRKETEDQKRQGRVNDFLDILRTCKAGGPEGSRDLDASINALVRLTSGQHVSASVVASSIQLLEAGVKQRLVDARKVCDALLSPVHMKHDNKAFWIQSFKLIRRIIHWVDYKGVREIMKSSIEKVTSFYKMRSVTAAVVPDSEVQDQESQAELEAEFEDQLEAVHQLLKVIFDRNTALLPSYFIVNELLKSYPENNLWPHWRIVPLVSNLVNSFRGTAQIVAGNRYQMRPIVEYSGRAHLVSTWKVDTLTWKYSNRQVTYDRILPFSREMCQSQVDLVKSILRQPCSKELVSYMLSISKQKNPETGEVLAMRVPLLEKQVVSLILEAVRESSGADPKSEMVWSNLSSLLIYFMLYKFINYNNVVEGICDGLAGLKEGEGFRGRGRDQLFFLLFLYISGSVSQRPLNEYASVFKLLTFYDEPEPLPVPEMSKKGCEKELAAAMIYLFLTRKAQMPATTPVTATGAQRNSTDQQQTGQQQQIKFSLPVALRKHYEFLKNLRTKEIADYGQSVQTDFAVPVVLNSVLPMAGHGPYISLLSYLSGNQVSAGQPIAMPGSQCFAFPVTQPLSLPVLDAMSVYAKIQLVHHVLKYLQNYISTWTQNGGKSLAVSPALVETHVRFLTYAEVESLGVKGVLNQLLPIVFKSNCWPVLSMVLEMFAYRLHYIQAPLRLQLLNTLQQGWIRMNFISVCKTPQLNVLIETTTLKLITGLGNTGVEPQSLPWLKEVMSNIMKATPHSWPQETLEGFPRIIQEFYKDNPGPPNQTEAQLNSAVEDEYKMWTSMSSEQDIFQHFSAPDNSLFLCVIWKILLEKDEIQPIAFKVLEKLGAKQLTSHLRSFCDLVVNEFNKSGTEAGHLSKRINAITSMIWKYNIIPPDKLMLCLVLRTYEGNKSHVCFLLLHLLLLKPQQFRDRIGELVKTMSSNHHLQSDFHAKHMEFHKKFPERFGPSPDGGTGTDSSTQLPTYFANVCLRLIPVFDIVIHRFLELPDVTQQLVTMINHVGVLYKFHDRPVFYLYNTLHYYEKRLRDRVLLKKTLIAKIVGAFGDERPAGWCLSPQFQAYADEEGLGTWKPSDDYYFALIGRLAATLKGGKSAAGSFPHMDWRFNEFPNAGAHALYVTCVEVMGVPVTSPAQVGGAILDVVTESHHLICPEDLPHWVNAIGLLLSNLPEAFSSCLGTRLMLTITTPPLIQWTLPQTIFQVLDAKEVNTLYQGPTNNTSKLVHLLSLAHAFWHHSGPAQITTLPEMVFDKLESKVKNEEQLLYVFHLVCPLTQRLFAERIMHPLFNLTKSLFRMLSRVQKDSTTGLKHMDEICDVLYHIKYQFIGDSIKDEIERCARDFRPELRRRLKFIAPGLQTRDNNGGLPDDSDGGSVGNNAASSGPQPKKPRQDF